MKKILIATHNRAKLKEIKYFLADLKIELLSLADLNIKQEAEENHATFKKNAIHKARFYCKLTNLPTISDDGGLEIDYLNGAPGPRSKRWINGKKSSDQDLINFTLKKLAGIKGKNRNARLTAVIALAIPGGKTYSYIGSIKGIIAEKPYDLLTPGFPYRSLLFLPKIKKFYHSKEMTVQEMEKYNHRGKVLVKIKKIISKIENNL